MRNWKELGEVPDSDDEDWDTEDSLEPLSTPQTLPEPQPGPRTDDIWDFHESPKLQSSAKCAPQDARIPLAQPQSSVSAEFAKGTEQLSVEQQVDPPTVLGPQDDNNAPNQNFESLSPLTNISAGAEANMRVGADHRSADRRDEVSPSIVRITASSADPFPGSSPDTFRRDFSVEKDHKEKDEAHFGALLSARTVGASSPIASETPVRGRRSLRPRKPIQEHPYLLENAKYSKAFKSHGLKPVRIAIAEQNTGKRRHEDSQDQDFVRDESHPGVLVVPDERSQRPVKKKTRRPVDDDDVDELALSQSPRTSSPQRHLRASSEQSLGQQTDDTSIHDDEDFPDIRDLTANRKTSKSIKRRTSPQSLTSKKPWRMQQAVPGHESPYRTQNEAGYLPPTPEPGSANSRRSTTLSPIDSPPPSFRLRAISRPVSPLRQLSPEPHTLLLTESINLQVLPVENEDESDVQEIDGSSSDSESELIRRTGRRIRGVLPASWLRLDQQTRKERTELTGRKPIPPGFTERPRPGLATKRPGLSKPSVSTRSFLDDLDKDDDGDQEMLRTIEQVACDLGRDQELGDVDSFDWDKETSVVQDDLIDWMLPGRKRNRASSAGPPRKRGKRQHQVLDGTKRHQQPKISESMYRLDRPLDSAPWSHSKETSRRKAGRAISPPALSIVDVVEPGAPKFIRIAARTATKRNDMGRSKPSNKSINLGNRADNVDALSVLKRWTIGNIKQRIPKIQPAKQKVQPKVREPLQPVASNTTRPVSKPPAKLSFNQPQKLSRQNGIDDFVVTGGIGVYSRRQHVGKTRLRKGGTQLDGHGSVQRPAQLEADAFQGDDHIVFGARKKMLDLVFHKSRKEVLSPAFQLQQSKPDEESRFELSKALPMPELSAPQLDQHREPNTKEGPRSRKPVRPRRLDLEAPQFRHANDPLSFFDEHSSPVEERLQPHGQEGSRIVGLGPFGTHYTQHFDIFPLHGDTFFHHTTVIGDGTLKKALCYHIPHTVTCDWPAVSFEFSNHYFQWGRWTDTISSELGVLFDAITESVEGNGDFPVPLGAHSVVDAAGNVLNYVLEFANFNEKSELRFFTQRMSELLVGFLDHTLQNSRQRLNHVRLQIFSRLLICALVLSRLCQGIVELSNQAQQAEDVLKRLAIFVVEKLVSIGLSDIRTVYDDLQRLGVRERGIKADNSTMTTWVVVMKVLETAQIPKAGFWDLVSSTVTAKLTHAIDAQALESYWRDMFTLLPLTEFDDLGVLNKGLRYVAPLQGWSLPQKLLKIVFDSYQANQRQSPSFNNYCRALLGRCHYLIEQWGWQKCVGIVGTIFDFFGSQSLSHLRNEEVYKSPRFLEELSGNPCLSVEPEDRCFHIFLKIVAVALQGMKRRGLSNDIRNLITRCLPNHNRQYSKEQVIHSHDLASLRNHHDLLCTLFWAAPPESRRPVALLEDLVRPASSHKEACLINLRAWSQLTRFVVSSGSSVQDYRPFMSWQNNVFHQVLNQYLSAAADVEHQFMSMAQEDRSKLQKHFVDSVVAANQNAAKDVLYFSVTASLDVIKYCPSLTAATFSFNVSQMNKTFNKLSSRGTDLDWGILRASFDTVDTFVSRLEDLCCSLRESTGDSGSTLSNREFEDAVEFLDDKIVQSFIAAARKAMISPACDAAVQSPCLIVEKAIILCGRIASLFIDGGKSSILHFFSAGKYGLFEVPPGELGLTEWRFVPLFVATLLKNHVFNFSSVDCTHFEIWMSLLVKPVHALRYEVDLAETLKALDMGYMKETPIMTRTVVDYNKNRSLFAGGISYMRREVRQAEFAQRRPTKAKYEKLLQSVMRQIKLAVRSLKPDSMEHSNYISFVRDVVGLIKSHGADICSVDPFFYQVSAEYSPPKEDPQLHTAGILAYGVRLGEGESTAIPQLFSYLYNHFKTSLASDRLDAEAKIIENGMKDDNILAFIIGRMLPAIIQASSHSNDVWPLLSVYTKALHNGLTRSCLPREIPEDAVEDAVTLLAAVLNWVRNLCESSTELTPIQAHIFTHLIEVCNAIRPSLACWLLHFSDTTSRLLACVTSITRVAKHAAAVLAELRVLAGSDTEVRGVLVKDLILAKMHSAPITFDSYVNNFVQSLIREVQNNWVVTPDIVTVRVAATPSTQRGTQAARGVKNDVESRTGLLSELHGELKVWISEIGEEGEENKSKRRKRRGQRHTPTVMATDF